METLQRTANRGSISTGFDIDNSLKLEPDNSEYLHKTPTSSGNRRTFTISMWIKRTEIGVDSYLMQSGDGDYNQSDRTLIKFDSTDNFRFGGGSAYQRTTNRVFRDTSAWYHIVMAVDTTDSTAANRLKLYVNGVQETSFSTSSDPSQNFQYAFCKDDKHSVGFNHTDNGSYYPGYMSEVILIDGQQLDPTSFGEFDEDTGIWKPIDVSGLSFGTNGFYLDFKDASNLGNDASGGTDFTLNNITSADQATDTPTNNFCTWLSDGTLFNVGTDNETFSEGGTRILTRSGTGWTAVYPTQSFAGGKWYMEVRVNETSATNMYGAMPVARINSLQYQEYYHGQDTDGSIGIYANNGQIYVATAGSGGYGGALSSGNIVGIAIDMENYKIYFAVNNTYVESGNPAGNSNGRGINQEPYVFSIAHYTSNTVEDTNFGGYTAMANTHTNTDENGYGSFVYAPPSGFLACCTKNLAEYGG